jgi:nucleolar protein 56
VFAHEAGVSFLDENLKVIDKITYVKNVVLEYQTLLRGEESDLLQKVVGKLGTMPTEQILVQTMELRDAVSKIQSNVGILSEEDVSKMVSEKVRIILDSGFVESEEKAYAKLREFSLRQSEIRIAEQSARLDLQAMQSVLALDELDKTINILGSRVKEWYFIHCPEILQFYDDPIEICKFVADVGDRKNLDDERLEKTKFSETKRRALYDAAQRSRGGIFREGDMERLIMLAEQTKELAEIRKRMADLTEKIMNQDGRCLVGRSA